MSYSRNDNFQITPPQKKFIIRDENTLKNFTSKNLPRWNLKCVCSLYYIENTTNDFITLNPRYAYRRVREFYLLVVNDNKKMLYFLLFC